MKTKSEEYGGEGQREGVREGVREGQREGERKGVRERELRMERGKQNGKKILLPVYYSHNPVPCSGSLSTHVKAGETNLTGYEF